MLIHDVTAREKRDCVIEAFLNLNLVFVPALRQEFKSLIQKLVGISLQNDQFLG